MRNRYQRVPLRPSQQGRRARGVWVMSVLSAENLTYVYKSTSKSRP